MSTPPLNRNPFKVVVAVTITISNLYSPLKALKLLRAFFFYFYLDLIIKRITFESSKKQKTNKEMKKGVLDAINLVADSKTSTDVKSNRVIQDLEAYKREIQKAEDKVKELVQERIAFCRLEKNKKEIKALYPKGNKIYQIKDIKKGVDWFSSYYEKKLNHDEVYFFKPTDTRFFPHIDFSSWSSHQYPTVKGDLLDCNLKKVFDDIKVFITTLEEVKQEKTPKKVSNNFTKVYVMIDKNTGYYKIGRSINPLKRERTLQSEKPTIEMLFNHDARIKDEKKLHDMFKEKRIRGEWFDLSGSDLNVIREYFDR